MEQPQKTKSATEWIAHIYHVVDESKFRVERSWHALKPRQRALICAIAGVDEYPHLRQYSEADRTLIAKAFKEMREATSALPPELTVKEFHLLDPYFLRGQHDSN